MGAARLNFCNESPWGIDAMIHCYRLGTVEDRAWWKRIYHMTSLFVIQWISSCHKKSYDHTCNNTLARRSNVIDIVRVINAFLAEIMFILKAIKIPF